MAGFGKTMTGILAARKSQPGLPTLPGMGSAKRTLGKAAGGAASIARRVGGMMFPSPFGGGIKRQKVSYFDPVARRNTTISVRGNPAKQRAIPGFNRPYAGTNYAQGKAIGRVSTGAGGFSQLLRQMSQQSQRRPPRG